MTFGRAWGRDRISVVLVYQIMALLFGSWLDPLVILFMLRLAVIGAIVPLFITDSTLDQRPNWCSHASLAS